MKTKDWTLQDFNDLIRTRQSNEILDEAGIPCDAVAALTTFGFTVLMQKDKASLAEAVLTNGIAMFAFGMEVQKYLNGEAKDDLRDFDL
jgi:hypothetical protein